MKLCAMGRTMLRLSAVCLGLMACGGAAEGPPQLIVDQTACSSCSMLISEPAYAAAYRQGGQEHLFDDLGCLLEALDREGLAAQPGSLGEPERVWVHDFETRGWLAADEAVFVRSPQLHTPMGGGLVALAERGAAEELAARSGGQLIESFSELLDQEKRVKEGRK